MEQNRNGINSAMASSRRRIVADSEDRPTISRSVTLSTRNYFELLSSDLVPEVLSRLPAKSIARFRCVSKPWSLMFRCPNFTEKFLTGSRPRLLFVCRRQGQGEGELLFFSTPQPQNLSEDSPLIVTYHMKFTFRRFNQMFAPVSGLVCFRDDRYLAERKSRQLVTSVCNPSTGQCFLLPKMNTRKRTWLVSFLGYDPVGKQFKVLSMISVKGGISKEHQVLTLGDGASSWRMIECATPHGPESKVVCINGVLYYPAKEQDRSRDTMIVCFDVGTEKFSFIRLTEEFMCVVDYRAVLFNYNGKLASFKWTTPDGYYICRTTTSFELCVLQDAERNEWVKLVYEMPHEWRVKIGSSCLSFVGMIGTDVVVLSSCSPYNPFYVFYYNTKKETVARAEVQGMGELRDSDIHTFTSHVENVKLMQI